MVKRLSLLLVFVSVMCLPLAAGAQDVTGASIEDIASSVVLIEAVDGRRSVSTGSGTIISPEGYIYTNRHVIQDGEDFAIYMLDDIRERPILQYYASLQYQSRNIDVDFAILKIDRDARGRALNPLNENLPYLPPTTQEVSVGETIRIFGYPGIGEGYMVVTNGQVVTVQNGSVGGSRLPVWYWTDAEISGGNSGGLAVNEAGEWVGLPTWVVSEERTAGRLGGILPVGAVEAMLAAEDYDAGIIPAQPPTSIFTLTNRSSDAICYVFVSPTTANNWGDDRLGERNTIGRGDTYEFSFEGGLYDILLLDCDGQELQDVRSVEIIDNISATFDGRELFWEAQAASSTLTIQNTSGQSICYVFISPTDSTSWGDDRLDEREIIRVGSERLWELEPDAYDVMLQDCGGETLEDLRGIEVRGAEVITYR